MGSALRQLVVTVVGRMPLFRMRMVGEPRSPLHPTHPMFVKRFSARSAILWCLAAGCAVTSAGAASFAEIQRIKNQVAIPHWKEAAARTQAAWTQESNPATLAIWRALDQQTDPLIGKAPLEEATSAGDAPQRH